jgi:Ring finger domain
MEHTSEQVLSIDNIINTAIRTAIVNNILSIYRERNQSFFTSSRYYNNPPYGGYQLTEEHEYILPDRDDMSSLIFLDIATRFGSPGSDNGFNERYKDYRKKKIKDLGKYKKIKEIEGLEDPCPICMDNFCCGEYQRTLECGHMFHKKCIDKWFKKDKNDCPMCRKTIIEV